VSIPSITITKDYKTKLDKSKIINIFDYLCYLFYGRIPNPNQVSTFYKIINEDYESESYKLDDFLKVYIDNNEFHVTYSIVPSHDHVYLHFVNDLLHVEMELKLLFENKDDIINRIQESITPFEVVKKDNKKFINDDFPSNYFEDNKEIKKDMGREIKIFISHGHEDDWKQLRDDLQDNHGYVIDYFEKGNSASKYTFEVLEEKLNKNNFALIIFSAEDKHEFDDKLHPRENVIHEAGLFQGRHGRMNVLLLVEKGLTEFSNILGITQIRYEKGNILAIASKVVAEINKVIKQK
jgi:predicted nucleotide-binding protein